MSKRGGVLPRKGEILAELRTQIEVHRKLRLPPSKQDALWHTIRCLEMALLIVKERKFPK